MYVIERRADGSKVARMVDGQEQVQAICVETGIRDWLPLTEVERANAPAGAGGPQSAAAGSGGVEQGPAQVLTVTLDREEEQEEQEEGLVVLGAVQPAGQADRGFWATNAGAAAAFFGLWAGAGMVGHFCGYMGPNAMVVGYLVGAAGWIGGYAYFLRGWYRSQKWQIVKAIVEIPVKDKKGRERVDRQGRVIVREEERAVAKRIGGRVYIKAWRPFKEQWVPAEVLGIQSTEVT